MFATAVAPWIFVSTPVLIILEALWLKFKKDHYDWREALASLGVAAGNISIGFFTGKLITASYQALGQKPLVTININDWKMWVIGFFAMEFFYYSMHRCSHTIRWMWASHSVHHSANHFTFPAAIRLAWTSFISGSWLVFIPLVLLGFPPLMIAVLLAVNLKYQFFLHTELIGRLGPLEWVLNTPSHHRVHHGSNQECLDKNYGGILIIFDRLFGSFTDENSLQEPIRYGLTTPNTSHNPFVIALQEWRNLFTDWHSANTFKQKISHCWHLNRNDQPTPSNGIASISSPNGPENCLGFPHKEA